VDTRMAGRMAGVISALLILASLFSGWVQNHPLLQQALVGLLAISEALAQWDRVKANSVSEAVVNSIAAIIRALLGKK
jgi:hypothetical protein